MMSKNKCVSYLQNNWIDVSFIAEGKSVDATQEMLALGACNVVSSFVSSMPVSGGLSRGAVNHSSGVKTTLGGVYTGLLVLISLQFLTPYLYYIPKAALAAVIIAAVVFMVEFQVVKPMWRSKSMFSLVQYQTLQTAKMKERKLETIK